MSTPVITKKEQRKSLSAKKGPQKGLKNVLAQPLDNYWPLLKNDHGAALENLLKGLLPAIKRSEAKVPWSHLRKMKKEERVAARQAILQKNNTEHNENAIKSVVFGINAVTRLLEKNDASCILVDASVDPAILIKHIITMSQNKNVPVLLISFLKKVTLDTIGFASAVLGLKQHVKELSENYFHSLFQKVSELMLELPPTKTPVSLFQNETLEGQEEDDKMCISEIKEEIAMDKKPFIVSSDVYLYRTSKEQRIFEPSSSSKEKPRIDNSWSDFIAVGDTDFSLDKVPLRFFHSKTPSNSNTNSGNILYKGNRKVMGESKTSFSDNSKVSYKPLKVKRLQGNDARTKATKKTKATKQTKIIKQTKAAKPPKVKKK